MPTTTLKARTVSLARLLVANAFATSALAVVITAKAQLPPPGPAAPASSVIPAGMAMVADSSVGGDRSSSFPLFPVPGSGEAIFFVLEEVDGERLKTSLQVQAAIVEGKVMRGMTRDQVVMAIGLPRLDLTGDVGGRRWVYTAKTESDDFDLDFDDGGAVREVNASSRVKRLVIFEPEPR